MPIDKAAENSDPRLLLAKTKAITAELEQAMAAYASLQQALARGESLPIMHWQADVPIGEPAIDIRTPLDKLPIHVKEEVIQHLVNLHYDQMLAAAVHLTTYASHLHKLLSAADTEPVAVPAVAKPRGVVAAKPRPAVYVGTDDAEEQPSEEEIPEMEPVDMEPQISDADTLAASAAASILRRRNGAR